MTDLDRPFPDGDLPDEQPRRPRIVRPSRWANTHTLAHWAREFLDGEPDEVCVRHFLSPAVSDGYCGYSLAHQGNRRLDELESCDIQLIRWVVVS